MKAAWRLSHASPAKNYSISIRTADLNWTFRQGLTPYCHNNKKRGEIDFIIKTGSKILHIEVKSGKDYETRHAPSNIMDCGEYKPYEAIVLNNETDLSGLEQEHHNLQRMCYPLEK